MYTAIKCPANLTGALRERMGSNYTGFWAVTQDPVLIQQAGGDVVRAPCVTTLKEALDTKLGTPANCTIVNADSHYIYRSSNDASAQNQLHDFARKTLIKEHEGFETRFKEPATSSISLFTFCIFENPQLSCDKISELDLLVLAARNPKGLTIGYNMYRQLAEQQSKFKIARGGKVHIVDDNFLIEELPGMTFRLMCDTKRVKRLSKLRAKRSSATDRNRPWLKYSCFMLMGDIISSYHHLIQAAEGMSSLYGYGRYSTNGIRNCMWAIPKLFALLKVMRKTSEARKAISGDLKLLTYHKATLQQRMLDWPDFSPAFSKWYDRETKLVGVPKGAKVRFKDLAGNVAKHRRNAVVSKLMVEEAEIKRKKGL